MADRHALVLEGLVVVLHPQLRLGGIDERECESPNPELRGEVDGLAVRAGHPQRRVRTLNGLGHNVAGGHREVLTLEARVRVQGEHVGDLLNGLPPHRAAVVRVDAEPFELGSRGRLAGAPLDPSVGNQVERGDAFGDSRRVVVAGGHQHDAMAETDLFGPLRRSGEEDLGSGGVAVLLEEVVLHLPRVIDPQLVGELHLTEGVLEELLLSAVVPGTGQLVLVEDAELHADSSAGRGASSLTRSKSRRTRAPSGCSRMRGSRASRS